ncbi:MAG: DUF1653 domain-containing protein [Gammaproteobacteria bacterium]|nr:DUF1653 domain-containing protein [Gammaproteobacteria bacterium]
MGTKHIARPGAAYRHFKGGVFTVQYIAIHSETAENLVIYTDESGVAWARPREMFEDGRYEAIGDAS